MDHNSTSVNLHDYAMSIRQILIHNSPSNLIVNRLYGAVRTRSASLRLARFDQSVWPWESAVRTLAGNRYFACRLTRTTTGSTACRPKYCTQPLIVLEEVGAIAKPMPLRHSCVIGFRAWLDAEHCGVKVIASQVRSIDIRLGCLGKSMSPKDNPCPKTNLAVISTVYPV